MSYDKLSTGVEANMRPTSDNGENLMIERVRGEAARHADVVARLRDATVSRSFKGFPP